MTEEKIGKAQKPSIKTYFFQTFTPEAISDAIEQADLDKVIHLIKSKKVSVDFVYGAYTPLFQSINLHRDSITVFLLDHQANPNAEFDLFDFRATDQSKGTIIQDIMNRNTLDNTQLLVLYGAFPSLTPRRANLATRVVAASASIDFKKRCVLEAQLETTLKQENRQRIAAELCEQLAKLWEEQAKINRQFPDEGNSTYQAHYQAKAAKYRQQKEQLLSSFSFPTDKKGFYL